MAEFVNASIDVLEGVKKVDVKALKVRVSVFVCACASMNLPLHVSL